MRFAEVGRTIGNRVLESVGRAASTVQETRPLPTDVLESDDAYLVVFDAPGATQTDVQVRYTEGAVEVRIDRFREFYRDFDMRVPGRGMSLDGRAKLPADADVDPQSANATLRKNGTLEVRVPKKRRNERPTGGDVVEISTPDDEETSSGERDQTTPGVRDETSSGERDQTTPGVRDETSSGERDETSSGERDETSSSHDEGSGDEVREEVDYSADDEDVDVGDETDPLESGTGTEPEDFDLDENDEEEDEDDRSRDY